MNKLHGNIERCFKYKWSVLLTANDHKIWKFIKLTEKNYAIFITYILNETESSITSNNDSF